MLHTFAHALIRQLAVEAGYSAASLRERIYSRNPEDPGGPMAGLLIYTAATDSEGTLGGLVKQGEPNTLSRHIEAALETVALCASDPICAENLPSVNGISLHAPIKHDLNPLIAGRGGVVNVVRDTEAGLFRMWYPDYWDQSLEPRLYTYAIAYAESENGIDWRLPRIGQHQYRGTKDNNIVLLGPTGGRAEAQFPLDVPEEHRRGYKYVLLYLTDDTKPHTTSLAMHLTRFARR
jgi:hypothetical protein